MSTETQLLGDSLRRQIEKSEEYASQQGWELLEENQLKDIGLSAYSGAHLAEGALGRFYKAIKDGKVPKESVLIVESLDRLSRQDPWKAFGLFSEIVNAGVDIVTLTDGRTYTVGSSLGDLIYSIVDMSRAHEESRIKSHRQNAAWENKRKNFAVKKMTANCPAWLSLSSDKKSFEILNERTEIVARIFEESAAGLGIYSITRRLNEVQVQPFGPSNGWHPSSVAKILNNRAVLGEFQPHRLLSKKRVPEGAPIKDYFPPIISEELFYRAQNARNQRRANGAGRKGERISNLFSGLAKCAYCKANMRFENKGPGPKGGTYLACDTARRGLGCKKTGWRYDHLEASFLAFVKELDLESLIRSESDVKKRSDLDNEIASLRGKIASIEQQREHTYQLFAHSGHAAGFVGEKLNDLEEQRTQLLEAIAKKEKERAELTSELTGFYESKGELKALLKRLQRSEGDDIYRLRSQISSRLKSLISVLHVASVGHAPATRKAIDLVKDQDFPDKAQVIEHFEHMLEDDREHRRYFLIGFKDGTVRGVYPNKDDPLEFEEEIVSSRDIGLVRTTPHGDEQLVTPKLDDGVFDRLIEEIE